MSKRPTSKTAGIAVVALSLSIAAVPAFAQVQQPAPPYGSAPGSAPRTAPMERSAPADTAEKTAPGHVEGSVKKVDPGAQTVQISSGLLGIMGRTLTVNDQTMIHVDGRQATLADLQEGSRVKAAYESRDGKNVATLIEVMPSAKGGTDTAPSPTMGDREPRGTSAVPGSSTGTGQSTK